MSYGIHINNINDIDKVIKYGGTWIQMMGTIPKFNKKINLVVHASFTINIASSDTKFNPGMLQFINEIELAEKLNAKYIVVHMGKQKDKSKEECYNNMITFLLYVHKETKKTNIKILIETPPGTGTNLCYKIEDFAYFMNKIFHHPDKKFRERFGVCIDTCHIFVAGYDISKFGLFMSYMEIFTGLIGLVNLKLVHLNDSLNEVGSRIDKHANLGEGIIGKEIIPIIQYFYKLGVPMITETIGIKKNLLFIKKSLY